jgi:hypothetical protein
MVGDSLTDIVAGKRAGCRTVLVLTGRGRESLAALQSEVDQPDAVATDLLHALPAINRLLQGRLAAAASGRPSPISERALPNAVESLVTAPRPRRTPHLTELRSEQLQPALELAVD